MSMLGKILLVVNFFVAAGLAYLIAQDWAARQSVTAVVARSALTLDGLPVEKRPTADDIRVDAEVGGLHVVETIRPQMLADHFRGTDGGPAFGGEVKHSQEEELQRVRD